MIIRPTIIITSLGRTGTVFLTRLFDGILKDCFCIHEAGSFNNTRSFSDWLWNIKKLGLLNLTVKKITGKWGLRVHSNKRITGNISIKDASLELIKQRKDFIESVTEKVYLESSYHYYGLIDVIPLAFKNAKIAYIVRDGRDWVRSMINRKGFYHRRDLLFFSGSNRLLPTPKDPYYYKWKNFGQFEKLCWFWSKVNNYALESINNNPNAKIFYFEDIFSSENKKENLIEFIEFMTNFDDFKLSYNRDGLHNFLERKINKPRNYQFPVWENWTKEQQRQFKKICGDLMQKLGYKL